MTGSALWCIIYLCCLLLTGYPLAAGLARGASKTEIAGLSACMGTGVMGICLIFLSMAGVRPAPGEIFAITGVMIVAGIFVWRFKKPAEIFETEQKRTPHWWMVVCFIAMGYGLLSVAIDAIHFPVIEWDAFAMWQLKAEVLAILPMNPRPTYFTNVSMSYSHLRYPLLVPMVSAGMHAMTGNLDDLGKTVSLLWYPAMIAVVFAAVRSGMNGTTAALTATALLACSTPMFRYGGSGTAEMALVAFYACSLLCMLRWQESQQWGYLILAALFTAWMAWTKNEGLALAAINVIVMALMGSKGNRRKSLAAAGILAAIVVLLYLPWIIYTWGIPRTDEDYIGRLNPHQFFLNIGKLKTVVARLGLELMNFMNWGLFWIMIIMLSINERQRFRNRAMATVGILLVLHLLAYIPPPMVVRDWKLDDLLSSTLDRLLMHAAPAGAILLGALWPEWAGGAAVRKKVAA